MRPRDRSLRTEARSRFHQQTAAKLAISLLREPRKNEMASVVEQKRPVAVECEMRVAIAPAGRLACAPHFVPGGGLQTREAAVAEDGVEIFVVLKQRRRDGCRRFRSRLPKHRSRWLRRIQLQHFRSAAPRTH